MLVDEWYRCSKAATAWMASRREYGPTCRRCCSSKVFSAGLSIKVSLKRQTSEEKHHQWQTALYTWNSTPPMSLRRKRSTVNFSNGRWKIFPAEITQ